MYNSGDPYERGSYRSEPPNKRYRRDDDADPTNPRPSIVVHVRNLSPKATEADLLEALSPFGPIAYASCIPHSRMALVEFEDLEGAKSCVSYAQTSQINVGGQVALFNYSTSHCIERMGFESSMPNKVLVLTVLNAQYPIDADVIYQICAPHGNCLRIAVMHKPTVVQALVEFNSIEVAKAAKHAMNGADIYSGCCTLKVEFAKPESVRVTRQDKDQRDYTMPNSEVNFDGPTRKILLSTKPDGDPYYGRDDGYSRGGFSRGGGGGYSGRGQSRGFDGPVDRYNDRGPPRYDDYHDDHYSSAPQPGGGPGCVLMVYGLDHDKINCDKLFNILCLYGNVLRINFMRSKVETGIIEMGTPAERSNVLEYCQGFEVFGLKLEFKPSHQDCVHTVKDPFNLNDDTPSFRDFSASRNQRFSTPEFASKNRIVFPTNILHWFNAPGTMDEEMLRQMISERSEHKPVKIDVFPSRNERSAAGTVEFATVQDANEVLANVNHTPVNSPYGSNPFIVKWAYATPRRWEGATGDPPRYKDENPERFEDGNGEPRSEGIKPAYRPSYRRGDSEGGGYRGGRGGYRGGFGGDRGGFGGDRGDRGSYRGSSFRGRGRGMSRY